MQNLEENMAVKAQVYNIKDHFIATIGQLPLSFEDFALTQGDELVLAPGPGKRRKIKLERTHYEFVAQEGSSIRDFSSCINFPSFEKYCDQKIQLDLVQLRSQSDHKIRSVYQLSSDSFFKVNGQWVQKALLRRGDIVDFALARFTFHKESKEVKEKMPTSDSVAKSNLPILIEGETGTGKTTLARKIHDQSECLGRFVHLNLSAFSSSLVESELFGHTKGAFTGAIKEKSGALALADKGTLFLDEIDSLSKSVQTKLLLFLDSGTYRSVGSNVDRRVNVRLISASGSNLREKVEREEIRQDFYHRLASGVKIQLPTLREDHELLHKVINDFSQEYSRAICPQLLESYSKFDWPGNIRQLHGHLRKKHFMKLHGLIQWDEYDEELFFESSILKTNTQHFMDLRQLKKNYIVAAMARFHGHQQTVANVLGVSLNTIKKFA